MESINHLLKEFLLMVPCHRKPERCLHIHGKPLPICARCMSILLGYFWVPILLLIETTIPWWMGIGLQIPMLLDGVTQLVKWRESNNLLRVITGLLSGFGLSVLIVSGARIIASWF